MTINLINNIAFLVALAATGQIILSLLRDKPLGRQVLLGVLFGCVALLGMLNPVVFAPGVIFDGRSIVLAVAGVVGGGVTAFIAAAAAVLYRFYLGGVGAPVGIAVAVLSASLGVLARHLWMRRSTAAGALDYLALGVVVQLMQLAAFTQIPNQAGYPFIEQAWWVLLLFYPLATMLLCLMFRNYEQQLQDRAALRSAQNARQEEERASLLRFHAYFDQSIVGLAITSLERGWVEVNDALCTTLGYSKAELIRMSWPELTHPDDLAADLAQFNRMLSGEIDSYAMDKRFIHKDGHVVYTRLAVSHVRKPDGSLDYVLAMVEDISERKQAEMGLLREKQLSQDILNSLPGIFYMFDTDNRLVRWNHQFSVVSRYSEEELNGKLGMDFFQGEDRRRVAAATQLTLSDGQTDLEAYLHTRDGRNIPYHFTGKRTHIGEQIYLLGVGVDISRQRKTQEVLETERAQLRTLVSAIPDLIWLKDMDGVYLSCNPEFERFFGASEAEIVGKTDFDFVSREQAEAFRVQDRVAAETGGPCRYEERISYASDGRSVLLETTKVPIQTSDGRVVGVLGIGHDISERKAHQKQLEQIAHYDILTGLPNRVLLADRLKQAVAQSQRHQRTMAVVYIDLDGFKAVNDRFGHEAGDQLLRALSDHMRGALREADTLARLGGDEFVAILIDLPDLDASLPLLSRLLDAASEVFEDHGSTLRVSASMGVSYFPQADAVDPDQLLRQADQAMYQAKLAGKNRYVIFDERQDRSIRGRHEGVQRIEQALARRSSCFFTSPRCICALATW
jgi:diguanylate cyclase (GGDEF)-like protein/PAS domain S-box-containing protein